MSMFYCNVLTTQMLSSLQCSLTFNLVGQRTTITVRFSHNIGTVPFTVSLISVFTIRVFQHQAIPSDVILLLKHLITQILRHSKKTSWRKYVF